jgi:hypothetical protein
MDPTHDHLRAGTKSFALFAFLLLNGCTARKSSCGPTSSVSRQSTSDLCHKLGMSLSGLPLRIGRGEYFFFVFDRAIENGANALAEGFLFSVAAALIVGETWRTSRNQSKRRDSVDDQIDELQTKVLELDARVKEAALAWENQLEEEKQRCVGFFLSSSSRGCSRLVLKARGAHTNIRTSSRNRTAWWIGRAPRYAA